MKKKILIIVAITSTLLITCITFCIVYCNNINTINVISMLEENEKNSKHLELSENNTLAERRDELLVKRINKNNMGRQDYMTDDEIRDMKLLQLALKEGIELNESSEKIMQWYSKGIENSKVYETDDFKESGFTKEEYQKEKTEMCKQTLIRSQYINLLKDKLNNGQLAADNATLKKKMNDYTLEYSNFISSLTLEKVISKDYDVEKYEELKQRQEDIVNEYIDYILK